MDGVDVCGDCLQDRQFSAKSLLDKVRIVERRAKSAHMLCATCTSSPVSEPILCESLDCPWMYARAKGSQNLEAVKHVQELVTRFPDLSIEDVGVEDVDRAVIDLT
jgi:DNA polymerase zeta